MIAHPPRRRMMLIYSTFYLVFAAVAARAVFSLGDSDGIGFMLGLLASYLLLLAAEPLLIPRSLIYLHILNALLTAIALLLLLTEDFDFFSLLLILPCAQSILFFPRKTAFVWIGVICVLMEAALLITFPIEEGIGYILIYPAAIALITGFCYLALQAEENQRRSEALLAELQEANVKLQDYAAQVKELAAANERNRLARELHDSVTQIIFGLTLSTQAARILLDRDPSRVAAQLDHMQTLAQSALAEMRALIHELHPRTIAEEGLAAGLRRLASERQANDGLKVELVICGDRRLPVRVEEELYHVAQEAVNNIVKHARTDRAVITLNLDEPDRVTMTVEDHGAGFDAVNTKPAAGHLGLTSMTERIQALGGLFDITSISGQGTTLRVNISLDKEGVHAG